MRKSALRRGGPPSRHTPHLRMFSLSSQRSVDHHHARRHFLLPTPSTPSTVIYVSRSGYSTSHERNPTMSTVAAITSCSTTTCAFNHGGCTAFAVTIGGAGTCSTLINLDARGGLPVADAHVGACQRLECVHNKDLMCTAEAITLGPDTATCLTYEAR